MKIHKDDIILVTKGKYKGKTGKVLKAMPQTNHMIVDGVNIVKKHVKPQKTGEKGKIIQIPTPINVSNLKIICKKCKKPVKIIYKTILKKDKNTKVRICKKCGKET